MAGVAYIVPAGLAGNQALAGGAVGMDFDVAHPIKVTKLGVFDDGSDGLTMTLSAVLYDRATRKPLATLDFTIVNQRLFNTFGTPDPTVADLRVFDGGS